MPQDREWKLKWSLTGVAVHLGVALAIGKLISVVTHLNWVASALWFLGLGWLAIAFKSYNEESLSYFDPGSGTFQPRFKKASRLQIFGTYMAIAIVLCVLGLLVQSFA